ncbi:hypothetical protein Rcae01_06786 [Novipirellula caenicola]|uniref:Uncharacterized protein n=1 Tax=Novipirellula caenicola TaxID=1536901 RepID=A0ABP9W384_9BACT
MDFNTPIVEIQILDPQPNRFTDPHPTSVQKLSDHQMHAAQPVKHAADLGRAHHRRNHASLGSPDRLDAAEFPLEYQIKKFPHRMKRHILSFRSDIAVDSQVGQMRLDIQFGNRLEVGQAGQRSRRHERFELLHVRPLRANFQSRSPQSPAEFLDRIRFAWIDLATRLFDRTVSFVSATLVGNDFQHPLTHRLQVIIRFLQYHAAIDHQPANDFHSLPSRKIRVPLAL